MKTLVIGLGNPILTDDGVGIYAARMVRKALPTDTEVDVIEVSVGGLTLMEAMVGYERVILIDALWMPGEQVGEVMCFNAGDLPDTLNTASAHDVDLPTALQVGKRLGAPLPNREDIHIVAVQIQDVLTFGESPTPPVVAAIPEAATQVLALLGYQHEDAFLPDHVFLSGGYDDFS
jgi:hydrogenase maturation protease